MDADDLRKLAELRAGTPPSAVIERERDDLRRQLGQLQLHAADLRVALQPFGDLWRGYRAGGVLGSHLTQLTHKSVRPWIRAAELTEPDS